MKDDIFRVIVADDERLIANNIAKNIERLNSAFRVVAIAPDGAEALRLTDELLPHVIFSDIKMPVMDGLELFAILVEKRPEIKKVIISGYDDFKLVREAMQRNAFDYLLKPVNREELRATLDKLQNQLNSLRGMLAPERPDCSEKIVEAIQAYLRENYARPIDFGSFASQYGFSGSYLTRIFREQVGISPLKYLIEYRITCAKRFLTDTELPVQEIGSRVGYPDPFHFSKIFKQYTGVSPVQFKSEWRSSQKGEQ